MPLVRTLISAIVLVHIGLIPAIAGSFVPTDPLNAPRSRAAGVVAGSGLLVAGGSSSGGVCLPVAAAESYDDATGLFATLAPMGHTRCPARAVSLDGGGVLIVGGFGQGLGSAELFDPAAGTFSFTGAPLAPRGVGFTLTRLADGRVLLAGGDDPNSTVASAEIYDPAAGTFSATGSMAHARSGHTATLLSDGRVLMAGGGAGSGCGTAALSAELFDPATGAFAPAVGAPVFPLWGHIAERLDDGRVLLAGGGPDCGATSEGTQRAQHFDPASGMFTEAASMVFPHGAGALSSMLDGGRILVTGGWAGPGVQSGADLYDQAGAVFSMAGLMGTARAYHAGGPLPGDRALVAGGDTGVSSLTASAEIFDADVVALAGTLRVTPRTLNRRSRGKVMTAFVGIPGDLTQEIDPDSLALFVNGLGPIAPTRVQPVGDATGDGTDDLQLKLPRMEVIALAPVGDDVVFMVSGTLEDGTPFVAQDGVRVICPGAAAGCSPANAFLKHVREVRRKRAASRRGL